MVNKYHHSNPAFGGSGFTNMLADNEKQQKRLATLENDFRKSKGFKTNAELQKTVRLLHAARMKTVAIDKLINEVITEREKAFSAANQGRI